MVAKQLLPATNVIVDLMNKGHTHEMIAAKYGVGPQAVYRQLQAAGLTQERPDYSSLIPWRVDRKHNDAAPIRNLRWRGKRNLGKEITAAERRRLDAWLA